MLRIDLRRLSSARALAIRYYFLLFPTGLVPVETGFGNYFPISTPPLVPFLPPPETPEGMGRAAGGSPLLVVKPFNHRHKAGGVKWSGRETRPQRLVIYLPNIVL